MTTKCSNCGAENPENNRFCGDCGVMILQSSQAGGQYGAAPKREPYKIRVNVLCIVGAMIAAFSLFLPWAVAEGDDTPRTEVGVFEFDEVVPGIGTFPDSFGLSVTIFLIGAAIAFFSPLGGIPLIIGSVGFFLTAATSGLANIEMIPYIGAAMAVISAAAVLGSLVSPIGPGYSGGKGSGIASNLLAWGVFS